MKSKVWGSVTVVAIGFLLLISGTLSYQLSIYHSKVSTNQALIKEYRNKPARSAK